MSGYPWSNSTGFGTKFTDPATLLPTAGTDVSWGVNSILPNYIVALTTATTPFINAYPFGQQNTLTGFGTKFANPATLPASGGNGVGMASGPLAVTATLSSSPTPLTAYRLSSSSFGTIYTAPASAPTGVGVGVSVSPSAGANAAVAVASGTSPGLQTYNLNSTTGWGTRTTASGTAIPPSAPTGVAYAKATIGAIAVSHSSSPFVTVVNTALTSKFANPVTLPPAPGRSVKWN
jgi:hypothetical protein